MKPITRTEKLKSWNSLDPYLKKFILKLLNGNELKFERYEPPKENNEPDKRKRINEGVQGRLF